MVATAAAVVRRLLRRGAQPLKNLNAHTRHVFRLRLLVVAPGDPAVDALREPGLGLEDEGLVGREHPVLRPRTSRARDGARLVG